MRRFAFTALVLVAACGPKGGGGTDPCKDKKMAAMTCDAMADHISGVMAAEGGTREMFVGECNQQGWSQETIDCMGMAGSSEQAEDCLGSMTPEQRNSLDEAFDAAEDHDAEATDS